MQSLEALLERCRGQEAAVAASRSVAGALQRPGSSSCSVWERCKSVAEPRKQQLQRLRALQERHSGMEVAVAASGSIVGGQTGQ